MLGLIPWIAELLLQRKPGMTLSHATRLAKIGVAIAAVVLLAGGVLAFFHFHDKGVIERHELESERDEANAALESERRASTAGAKRDEARRTDDETTQDELETIHAEDPDAAARPASRGSRAVADRLRR